MLELQILAANVLLPAIVLSLTLWALQLAARKRIEGGKHLATGVVIVASSIAIWAAFGLRVGFAIWPEDAWARLPVAVSIVSLASLISIGIGKQGPKQNLFGWAVRAAGLAIAAKAMIPSGEAWEFLQPTATVWFGFMLVIPLISWFIVERVERGDAGLLGLCWIPCVVAAAFLCSDFLRVTEPLLAVAVVLGLCSIAVLISRNAGLLAGIAGPCCFAICAAVANAQFNSFLGLPDALSWFAMSTTAIVAIVAWCLPMKSSADGRIRKSNVALSCGLAIALAVAVIVWKVSAAGFEDY